MIIKKTIKLVLLTLCLYGSTYAGNNIYSTNSNEEIFKKLGDFSNYKHIEIEEIISTGQTTPKDKPYNQNHDEWVYIVSGKAKMQIENKSITLNKGDYLLIKSGETHWVTYTENKTEWIAIHLYI
ncbi:cupin domain protein [Francisella philomiragia]|uniref:cupin domain-containing protein n=1 Tax=Francisella philomiragia TaxID=28110 RepID=UPI0005A57180|nr:cupin domain-containing protein [Francisella philomiragia]AJI57224.1 cupin domain protein [Francisella philomiragia]